MTDKVAKRVDVNTSIVTIDPLAVDRAGAARLCRVSASQWDRWRAEGRTPQPCVEERDELGRPRLVRWLVEDIRQRLADGTIGRVRRAHVASATGREESKVQAAIGAEVSGRKRSARGSKG